jgi:S-adenosylmethionine uptake transporter
MTSRKLTPAAAFAVGTLGIAIFSCMDAMMKGLALDIGAYNALLWRSFVTIAIAGALYLPRRPAMPAPRVMRLHTARAVVSAAMAVLFFWGLARIPMAQAIALAFIAPLIALFLAAVFLKERIGRATFVASGIAFAGVLTVMAGQARADMGHDAFLGAMAVLASAVCYACNLVLMRAQSLVASPVEATFWQSLIISICYALAAPWFAHVPEVGHAPMLVLAALFATVSLLLLSWAYAHGEASYLVPTEYTAFVWASLLGWLVFREALSPWTLAGAALIVGGCIIAARIKPLPLKEPIA